MTTNPDEPKAPSASDPLSVLGDALEAAAAALHEKRDDVRGRLSSERVQSGASQGAYYAAYGVSYGVVFTGVFLRELLPGHSSIRRGFEAGGRDGAKAAVGAVAKIQGSEDDDDLVEERHEGERASETPAN